MVYEPTTDQAAKFTMGGDSISPALVNGGVLALESTANIDKAHEVGQAIGQAIHGNLGRSTTSNPVLEKLAKNPLQTLHEYGLPANFFATTPAWAKDEYAAYLTKEATTVLDGMAAGAVPRGFFACWACRIGFGAIIFGIGAALTAAGELVVGTLGALIEWVCERIPDTCEK